LSVALFDCPNSSTLKTPINIGFADAAAAEVRGVLQFKQNSCPATAVAVLKGLLASEAAAERVSHLETRR
jgi:hypothetical protein